MGNYYTEIQKGVAEFGTQGEDGWYVDSKGCSHEDLESLLRSSVGLCGCGNPEDTLKLVAEALEIIVQKTDGRPDGHSAFSQEGKDFYDKNEVAMRELMGNDRSVLFMLYYLNDQDLVEHGSSIYGSWLTARGYAFLEAYSQLPPDTEVE